jgi:hypothetical protein
LNSGALRVLDHALISQGAGAINFMRQLGGAVGVSLLSVALERQTTLFSSEFNALETGQGAATETIDQLVLMLGRAGILDNLHVARHSDQAYQFLSQMIAAQGSVMGFRQSFLLVAAIFLSALLPAWFMRPGRHRHNPPAENAAPATVGR